MQTLTQPSPMRYVKSDDGVRIAYVTIGDGTPLVFAANIFGEATSYCEAVPFAEVQSRLVQLGWQVILYDQRGMGHSDRQVDDFTLDARVSDLTRVVTALRLERFALAAIDVGAPTAIAYAADNPDRVIRLALLSPWASGQAYLALPALRAAYAAESGSGEARELFADILGSVASGFRDPDYVRQGSKLFLQYVAADVLSAFNAASAQIDIRDRLPHVSMPTLVTHERAFPFGSLELCREVAAGIPDAEFVVLNANSIAGRDHDENVAVLDRFLRARPVSSDVPLPNGLTQRELEVLRRIATGASNKEVAAQLGIAVSTAERHLANLYMKIGARGRADAIAFALRRGLDRTQ